MLSASFGLAALSMIIALPCMVPIEARADQPKWFDVTPGPHPRRGHAMAFDSDRGVAVLFSGFNGSTRVGDTWEWDVNTNKWTQQFPTVSPSGRRHLGMGSDAANNGIVSFTEGCTGSRFDGETCEWNGSDPVLRATAGLARSPIPQSS